MGHGGQRTTGCAVFSETSRRLISRSSGRGDVVLYRPHGMVDVARFVCITGAVKSRWGRRVLYRHRDARLTPNQGASNKLCRGCRRFRSPSADDYTLVGNMGRQAKITLCLLIVSKVILAIIQTQPHGSQRRCFSYHFHKPNKWAV